MKMKYLWMLGLVALVAALASSVALAEDWIALEYRTEALQTTTASMANVPDPNEFSVATFSDVPVDDPETDDVDELHWAWALVEECANTATESSEFIVQGYGGGTYQPGWDVTRSQMAVFIARAAGYTDEVDPEAPSFQDVPSTYWAFTEIEQCVLNEVVKGYADYFGEGIDAYLPGKVVTRDQMAVYIQRAAGFSTSAVTEDPFPDVAADSWAAAEIQACVDNDVVAGYADGLYRPAKNVTRDQMAVFIWRGLVREEGDVVLGGPAATDEATLVPSGGEGEAEMWLADELELTGCNTMDDMGTPDDPDDDEALPVEPSAVVFIVLDAAQVPTGDIVFEVSHVEVNDNGTPDDEEDDFDETIVDDDATLSVVAADAEQSIIDDGDPGRAYLVASYQLPAEGDLGSDEVSGDTEDYTCTVTLPEGAVLTIGEFGIEQP